MKTKLVNPRCLNAFFELLRSPGGLCVFVFALMFQLTASAAKPDFGTGYFSKAADVESATLMLQQTQRRTVTGKVTDSSGQALLGVSVVIQGVAGSGTTTDMNGMYVLELPNDQSTLIFTLVGYKTLEVFAGTQTEVNAVMGISTATEDEIVVVGFGTQKKKEVVGSIVSVNPSDLVVPASNLTTAFAGRIAGMIAYQRSGEPGMDDADFFIRGVTSFGIGKRDPLILIDQVEYSRTDLARLKPDDIESFSVLKDATATAVYGARGANGVISVVTKKGREGRARTDFRAEAALTRPTKNVEFADPITFMNLYNDAYTSRNPFAPPYYSRQKIDATAEGQDPILYPANDWKKMMFKDNSFTHRYNLSVRGGGKVARYYVTGSFSQDNGMLRVDKRNNFNNNVNFKTYTLRSNVDMDITKTTQLIVRLTGNFDNYNGPRWSGSEMYNLVARSNPVDFPAYYPIDEEHKHITHIMFGGLRDGRAYLNPYAAMVSGYREYDRSLLGAQLELRQDLAMITKGLSFHAMVNANKTSRFEVWRSYNPFYYDISYLNPRTNEYQIEVLNPETGTEYLDFFNHPDGRQQLSVFYSQATLNYNRTFDSRHTVSGMLVGLAQSTSTGTATQLQLSLPSRNVGISGRASYGYDNRYFAEFNFGYNASERFDRAHRWGFFPSAGIAWTVSNEKFMEPIADVITLLKLRATYGYVGNDAIGSSSDRFFYLSNVNMTATNLGARFGDNWAYPANPYGINVTRYANPDIRWEKAAKTNLGIELNMWRDLQIQVDLYEETKSNILMDRASIPSTMGLSAPVRANVGKAKARGMDVAVTSNHSFANGMWLQAMGNFTYAVPKYLALEEPLYDNEPWLSKVGQKLSQPYGFLAERLFVDDAEVFNSPPQSFGSTVLAGDIKYKDVNGDGRITDLDKVPIGFPTEPEITYGFGLSAGYKNFDISSFFQGLANESFWIGGEVWRNGVRYAGPQNIQPFVGGNQILKVFADDHYSLADPNVYAAYPRLSDTYQNNNMQFSSWWLRNGKFLRLKHLEVGYTLPRPLTSRLRFEKIRMYLSGTNLLTFSQFKLYDVEMGGNGLGYPVQRVFNFGINASL